MKKNQKTTAKRQHIGLNNGSNSSSIVEKKDAFLIHNESIKCLIIWSLLLEFLVKEKEKRLANANRWCASPCETC